ncbi:hypothetical protein GW571_14790 (plasmid) [Clavibacter capsici]|uniref:Uncharacterized protein n=1 Tax=Clavibacter capsici TaxID=1874630 RepID=A0AAE6XTH4_9MICO|nr:hypothetical protein [Clavibacter capsici]QIS40563.1 hypothetical protein GW572_15430 [Clavibacter capsici]QIS43505.1 hypothetical protein GW571_14790 [Clavibacter capsici]QIS46448.1 hypothetical protein GW570_14760 [Clavibacter capsici]
MPLKSSSDVRRLDLLGAVIAHVDAGEPHATPGALMRDSSDEDERRALSTDVRVLRDLGYMDLEERMAGMWLARPSQAGRDAWNEFDGLRGNRLERQKALRNVYLRWLYELVHNGRYPQPGEFLESGVNFLGTSFTKDEEERAAVWLKERAFIRGQGSWGHPAPIHPEVTAKGEDYVENDRDVHADPRAIGGGATTNFNGPTQIAYAGRDANMVQNNQGIADEARHLAQAVQQLATLVDGAQADALVSAARDLEEEAASGARPTRLRAIAEAAQQVLAGGAAGALGNVVSDQIGAFIASLPL